MDIAGQNIPWIDLPLTDEMMASAGLDEETMALVRHYAEHGYVIFDPKIPDSILDEAAASTVRLCSDSSGKMTKPRVTNAWRVDSAIREIAVADSIMKLLRVFYRRDPIPFQTLNFLVGTQQKTHSDSMHFSSFPHRYMCGVWVALEDIHAKNGPLHYYPGSHKLPFFEMYDIGRPGSMGLKDQYGPDHGGRYEEFVESYISNQGLQQVELHIPKGKALIWAANLFHGGNPILDPNSTRLSQVTHYFFSDCIYYTPLLSDPYVGQFFLRRVENICNDQIVEHHFNGSAISVKKTGLYRFSGTNGKAKRIRTFKELVERFIPTRHAGATDDE